MCVSPMIVCKVYIGSSRPFEIDYSPPIQYSSTFEVFKSSLSTVDMFCISLMMTHIETSALYLSHTFKMHIVY